MEEEEEEVVVAGVEEGEEDEVEEADNLFALSARRLEERVRRALILTGVEGGALMGGVG